MSARLLLQAENLGKCRTESAEKIFSGLNIRLFEHEVRYILGKKGSGKTTLLNVLSGLMPPDEGQVLLGGQPLTGPAATCSVVWPKQPLLPWLSLGDNLDFAIRLHHPEWDNERINEQVWRYLSLLEMADKGGSKPAEWPAPVHCRLILARAFAVEPCIVFIDEPFSPYDAASRRCLQQTLQTLLGHRRQTLLLTGQNRAEARLLADHISEMNPSGAAGFARSFDNPDRSTSSRRVPLFP